MDRIVDIHNHIIFDVDDGPDTLQTSMDMMRQAVEKKVTDIVATPHQFEQDLTDHVRRQEKVLGNFEILKAEVKKEKLPLKLHLFFHAGGECAGDTFSDREQSKEIRIDRVFHELAARRL